MKVSEVEDRGGSIESSIYTTHLGASEDFISKMKGSMDIYKSMDDNLVFISDGLYGLKTLLSSTIQRQL
jgi:hypothetical protein